MGWYLCNSGNNTEERFHEELTWALALSDNKVMLLVMLLLLLLIEAGEADPIDAAAAVAVVGDVENAKDCSKRCICCSSPCI